MASAALPADPTLDEIRLALAPAIGRNAAFDGWTPAAVSAAANEIGIDPDVADAFVTRSEENAKEKEIKAEREALKKALTK